ncbi:MAG: hypothetical protein IPM39_21245 [Chloroflexi bacterium]|nr:hypothetical protein [Chloroflexota bacterium]
MSDFPLFAKKEPVMVVILCTPPLFFLLLILLPALDSFLWINMQFDRYIHYYLTAFSGFVALNIALYSSGVFGQRIRARMQFITLAFSLMAGLLLLSGLATPGVLFAEADVQVSLWSLYLSLPVGALFFTLAAIRWSPQAEAWLARWRWWLVTAVFLLFGGYVWLITAVPLSFLFNLRLARMAGLLLAGVTIALYLWSAARIRVDFDARYTFSQRLALTLALLAEAQFFLWIGRSEALSRLFFYPVTLLALLVAVWAILSTLRDTEDLQVSRYFAAAGSVLIVGFSLLSAEFIIRVFDLESHRPVVLFMLLMQGVLGFFILYIIVAHLDRLVHWRTDELQREQRLRAELTQMVIHDLKSPLTVIRSGIGMLSKGHLGAITARQQQVLVRADESSQRILQLIDNLLDVERLEAGALPLKLRHIESTDWLCNALTHWEVVSEAQGKNLRITIPEDLPALRGDRELLQRVLNNLLTNALNYATSVGVVEVRAYPAEKQLVVEVIDDGPGVADADKLRIFDKFAQVDGTQRRGTGLGLTFCKMVVEAHQGGLAVSDNPDGGAIFRLALPICVNGTAEALADETTINF